MAKILDKTRSVVLVKFSLSEFKGLNISIDSNDKKDGLLKLANDTKINGIEFKNSKEMLKHLNN